MSVLTDARTAIGGLSAPGKMPCHAWSIPAAACHVGGKLRQIPGSVCANCYAWKGRYPFQNVQTALYRRLAASKKTGFVDNMVRAINGAPYFRWFDSGDIQSSGMLSDIADIARATPKTMHWLPTRELKIVRDYSKIHDIPDNLIIRLSATMVDGKPPAVSRGKSRKFNTSTVHTGKPIGTVCPANQQGGKCNNCRACWNRSIKNISYPSH